jgi:coenzyme F420-reducing hydrogenase beta subunit
MFDHLIDKIHCTGCFACMSICPIQCITMEADSEGFFYPLINQNNCINCGLCQSVCPALQEPSSGRMPLAFAAYNKNENIRIHSSSGGLFTAFAEQVIDQGGIVFGASFDSNFHVTHCYAKTHQELERFRGSKYVQSNIGNTYRQAKDFLDQGNMVYFSGTPCQISGLKSFLKKEYDNLICQDLICHGVPSPKVWEKYIKLRENFAESPVDKIFFRDKTAGWKKFSLFMKFQNGKEYRNILNHDYFLQTFLNNIDLRPSCYQCMFRTWPRQSDLTLADFWGIEKILPNLNDNKGISLLLVHTEKGRKLLEESANGLFLKKVHFNQLSLINPLGHKQIRMSPKRKRFFARLDSWSFDKLIKRYGSPSLVQKIKNYFKAILKVMGLYDGVKKLIKRS